MNEENLENLENQMFWILSLKISILNLISSIFEGKKLKILNAEEMTRK